MSHRITQLIVRLVGERDGKSTKAKLKGGGCVVTLSNPVKLKEYNCLFTVATGERFQISLMCGDPPSVEIVQAKFDNYFPAFPRMFQPV